jgi:hypothetical protein
MVYQFRTASDDQLFVFNTVDMTWGRASSIVSAPSLGAVENRLANFEFLESGTLVPMGAGAYNFDGRTPETGLENPKAPGPGAGLSTVGIMAVPYDTYLILFLRANVKIKDESFKSNFPEEAQKFIKHRIIQPEAQPQGAVAAA